MMNPEPRTRISQPAPTPLVGCQKSRYARGCVGSIRAKVASGRHGFGVQRFESVAPFVASNVAVFIVAKQWLNLVVQRCNVICKGFPYTGARTAAPTRASVRCTVAPLHYYPYLIDIYKKVSATNGATLAAISLKALHQSRLAVALKTPNPLKTVVYWGKTA